MIPLQVCAGIVLHRTALLLSTRPPGSHLAGTWEFPGGKCRPGEPLCKCIHRELLEELGITVDVLGILTTVHYHYPGKSLDLHFLGCGLAAETEVVTPTEGQQAGWFSPADLPTLGLAPADRHFLDLLAANELPAPAGVGGATPVWAQGNELLRDWLRA